jgi:redox-sensitive bicupin YhaK (pirin superfamily)
MSQADHSPLVGQDASRRVLKTVKGLLTSDGAGVKLTRVIGQPTLMELDPFLLLDEFGTDKPEDYIGGFPSHPHRGFETVTYMLDGRMRHKDNHGHEGVLAPGSVQWMTAGRGIVHSEMPEQEQGRMRGFQLWINLPARDKMTAPRYQEYAASDTPSVPGASLPRGVTVKVIAGSFATVRGPIEQPATAPLYLDLTLESGSTIDVPVPRDHSVFVYVYEGAVSFACSDSGDVVRAPMLAVLGDGEKVTLRGAAPASRAILVAGRVLGEPVARHGPFVMNTRDELRQAVDDFNNGRF